MAAYRKMFNGKGYICSNIQEGTKQGAIALQKKLKARGHKARVVKTKNGFSGKVGYTVYTRD